MGILVICLRGAMAAAPGDAALPKLVMELTDGSRIIGTPTVDGFKIESEISGLQVQFAKVSVIEFSGADHAVDLKLRNGDHLSGKLGIGEIPVKTIFGQAAVPVAAIKKITVRVAGGGMPDGLVLYYSFDTVSGDQVADESGSGNDGTIRGATHVGEGKVGGAMSFSGANAQKVVAKNEDKLQLQDFTIMAWVKRGSTEKSSIEWAEGGVIFACGQGGYGFGIYANGIPGLSKIGINGVAAPDACKIIDQDFHHVAVTKSGSKVVFYLDGKPYETKFDTQFQFGNGMGVGARPDIEGPMEACFLGTVDELGVFNRALTEDEVQAVYNLQK